MASPSPDSSRAFLARVWMRRDGAALGLLATVMVCVLVSLLALISPSVESYLIARQQSRAGFLGHVALLPYASMYTLDHEVCVGIPEHSMGEVAAEDAELCERYAYSQPSDGKVSCQALSSVGSSNHFPTAGLFHFGALHETCGGDWLDVVVVSRGWRTTSVQHMRLHLEGPSPRWETVE